MQQFQIKYSKLNFHMFIIKYLVLLFQFLIFTSPKNEEPLSPTYMITAPRKMSLFKHILKIQNQFYLMSFILPNLDSYQINQFYFPSPIILLRQSLTFSWFYRIHLSQFSPTKNYKFCFLSHSFKISFLAKFSFFTLNKILR